MPVRHEPVDRSTNPNGGRTSATGSPAVRRRGLVSWVDPSPPTCPPTPGRRSRLGFRYWTDGALAGDGFAVDEIAITGPGCRWGRDRSRLGVHRVLPDDRDVHRVVLQRLLRRVPQLSRLRRRPADGAVQLRLPEQPTLRLGRALPVPGRPAGLVLRHLVPGQQRRRRLRGGRCGGLVPAGRRASGPAASAGSARCGGRAFSRTTRPSASSRPIAICLHIDSVASATAGYRPTRCSTTRKCYWVPPDASIGHFGWSSVQVPKTGTTIRVVSTSAQDNLMQVLVNK